MSYEYLKGRDRKEEFQYLEFNSRGDKSYYNYNWVIDSRDNEFLEVCDEFCNSYDYYDLDDNHIAYVDGDYPINLVEKNS